MIETYDELAEEYGRRALDHGGSTGAMLRRILLPQLSPGARFLDVGCAIGAAVEQMADAGHEAVGIDASAEMVRVARRDRHAGRFECVDWLRLMTGGWDVIMAFAFLHLFPKAEVPRLLAKLRAEVRPGGLIYVGTTIETEPREGYEGKADYPGAPLRFRARWTREEALCVWPQGWILADASTHETNVAAHKVWLDLLLRRPE